MSVPEKPRIVCDTSPSRSSTPGRARATRGARGLDSVDPRDVGKGEREADRIIIGIQPDAFKWGGDRRRIRPRSLHHLGLEHTDGRRLRALHAAGANSTAARSSRVCDPAGARQGGSATRAARSHRVRVSRGRHRRTWRLGRALTSRARKDDQPRPEAPGHATTTADHTNHSEAARLPRALLDTPSRAASDSENPERSFDVEAVFATRTRRLGHCQVDVSPRVDRGWRS